MFTCAFVFLCVLGLVFLYLATNSKRQNISLLLSFVCSFSVVAIIYSIIYNSITAPYKLIYWISDSFSYMPNRPQSEEAMYYFAYGFFYIILFLICFVIFELLTNILLPKKEMIRSKTRGDYVIKWIMVFVNTLIAAFVIIFILTDINIIYGLREGFLGSIMEIFREALYKL